MHQRLHHGLPYCTHTHIYTQAKARGQGLRPANTHTHTQTQQHAGSPPAHERACLGFHAAQNTYPPEQQGFLFPGSFVCSVVRRVDGPGASMFRVSGLLEPESKNTDTSSRSNQHTRSHQKRVHPPTSIRPSVKTVATMDSHNAKHVFTMQ